MRQNVDSAPLDGAGEWFLTADRVLTPHEVLIPGWVHVQGSRVAAVGVGRPAAERAVITAAPAGHFVTPGLVDMHVHGAGGGDMTAPDPAGVDQALRTLARHGVTACVASLVTAPEPELEASLSMLAGVVGRPGTQAARLLGAHLEGPFLSPEHLGAHHEPSLRQPDLRLLRRLLLSAQGTLRMMTLAPELPDADQLLARLRADGVTAAMGHTAATYAQTRAAITAGVTVGTHLFNGMRRPHHREPGPALSLLDSPEVVVELINDGEHVHPAVARVAARAAGEGRLALISDGVAATAAPEGAYMLGKVAIRSREGRVETADGSSLGGGISTLDQSLRRAITVLGLDTAAAVQAATSVPARALGVAKQAGSLEAGRQADVCVFDPDTRLVAVLIAGEWLTPVDGLSPTLSRQDLATPPPPAPPHQSPPPPQSPPQHH